MSELSLLNSSKSQFKSFILNLKLFLIDSTLQGEVQEGILHPAQNQDSTKGQENTLRPIHPPLIITINLEEEEEEEQEEKCKYFFKHSCLSAYCLLERDENLIPA